MLLTVLTGCWDEKEIGVYGYVTALGIDFEDENYMLYVQMLDFSNVAKQEDNKVSNDPSLFIGKSSGETIYEAVNNLYKTSQKPLHWGQMGAIIYSETVLEKDIEEFQQAITRSGDFRYTPWIFGTNDSIEELFSVSGFFHLPPVYTILYQPEETYEIYSYIEPLRMYDFISLFNDPGSTVVLPSITMDTNAWRESGAEDRPKNTLRINGGYQITEGKYQDWMSYEDLTGIRWVQKKTNITPVKIIDNDKEIGIVEITDPSTHTQQAGQEEEAKFEIKIKAKGMITDLQEGLNQDQIENLVENQIREEIITTYQKGIEKNIDVYNFKNILFRNGMEPEKIKEIKLSEDSLSKITVDFHLESKGIFD
jgi:Ger(x)C family germination protein